MSDNNKTIGKMAEDGFNAIATGEVFNMTLPDISRTIRNIPDSDTREGNISLAVNEKVGTGAGIMQTVRNFFVGISEVFSVGAQFFSKLFEGLGNGNFIGTMAGFSADLVNSGRDLPQNLLDRHNGLGVAPGLDPSDKTPGASATTPDSASRADTVVPGNVDTADSQSTFGGMENPTRTIATVGGATAGGVTGGIAGAIALGKLGAGLGAAAGAPLGGFGAIPGAIAGGLTGAATGLVLGSGVGAAVGGAVTYVGTSAVQGVAGWFQGEPDTAPPQIINRDALDEHLDNNGSFLNRTYFYHNFNASARNELSVVLDGIDAAAENNATITSFTGALRGDAELGAAFHQKLQNEGEGLLQGVESLVSEHGAVTPGLIREFLGVSAPAEGAAATPEEVRQEAALRMEQEQNVAQVSFDNGHTVQPNESSIEIAALGPGNGAIMKSFGNIAAGFVDKTPEWVKQGPDNVNKAVPQLSLVG